MAYVPKFVHDIFLSYAHLDNVPYGGRPWVSRFREELEAEMRRELALWGSRTITIWHDETRLAPGYSLSRSIQDSVRQSATMLSLYSPAYLASGYCADERRLFLESCGSGLGVGQQGRLVNVVIRSSPEVQRMLSGDSVYASLADGGVPAAFESGSFQAEFRKLTSSLVALLREMRKEAPAVYVALPAASDTHTTEKTCELLEDLSRAGYRRTSEVHPHFYTDDQSIIDEVGQGVLSVHLIDDPSESLSLRQLEAAQRTDKPMTVWLSPKARRSSLAAQIHETFPGPGREYLDGSFPEFVQRVKVLLDRIQTHPSVAVQPDDVMKKVLFLYNPQKDREAAARVTRRLEAERFEVIRPGRGSDEALRESDGVLLFHSGADDVWFETKLRMVSSAPRRTIKAAWTVSPPDKAEARRMALDSKFRHLPEVDRSDPRILMDGDDIESVASFVSALRS